MLLPKLWECALPPLRQWFCHRILRRRDSDHIDRLTKDMGVIALHLFTDHHNRSDSPEKSFYPLHQIVMIISPADRIRISLAEVKIITAPKDNRDLKLKRNGISDSIGKGVVAGGEKDKIRGEILEPGFQRFAVPLPHFPHQVSQIINPRGPFSGKLLDFCGRSLIRSRINCIMLNVLLTKDRTLGVPCNDCAQHILVSDAQIVFTNIYRRHFRMKVKLCQVLRRDAGKHA